MNVSIRLLTAFWFFTLLGTGLSGQILLDTYIEEPVVSQTFSSLDFFPTPTISSVPANGTATVKSLGGENYVMEYQPNSGFIGNDVVQVSYWAPPATPKTLTYYINILKSEVEANRDFTGTNQSVSVDIDVLGNDLKNGKLDAGSLTITQISLNNGGTIDVSPDGKIITFTPAVDFTGITHFNYIACDEFGSCDQGTVTVSVYSDSENNPDTLRIFTKKNKPQAVFIPQSFGLSIQPQNGTFDRTGEIPRYFPDVDFTGTDYLTFEDDGQIKVVEVKVLDLVPNIFAFDDAVYTTSYEPIEFNVLQDDLYGINSGCLSFGQPRYGNLEVVEGDLNGTFKYTPMAGFSGVDQFTYTIQDGNCSLPAETATVYVYVSNFEPSRSKFRMTAIKKTPLVVAYSIPIDGYKFEVTTQAQMGEVIFMPGSADTTIYGRRIKGFNVLLYIPDENIEQGMDEFELNYCVLNGNACQFEKFLKIEVDILNLGNGEEEFCIEDCIWPGDTNLDGIVDVNDLLPIGLHMGEIGPRRADNPYEEWYGEFGSNWGANTDNFNDLKHVDANGDSTITASDTSIISENYGRTHSLIPSSLPEIKNRIVLQGATSASPGDVLEFDVLLGSEVQPAEDVYGFTFPVKYNPVFFDPEKVEVSFNDNSWMAYDSPILSMTHNDMIGKVEAAYTRTNGLSISGFGTIGRLRVVIDDLPGFRPDEESVVVHFGSGTGSVMSGSGHMTGVLVEGLDITLDLTAPTQEELMGDTKEDHDNLLQVYPNPAFNDLNIHFNGKRQFERVLLSNIAGQRIYDSGKINESHKTINISQFNPGMYFLSIQTNKGIITRKVEIIK